MGKLCHPAVNRVGQLLEGPRIVAFGSSSRINMVRCFAVAEYAGYFGNNLPVQIR